MKKYLGKKTREKQQQDVAKKAERKGKKTQNKNRKPIKIGYKMILGYCVPVILMVLLGVVSYQRSMKSIKAQYEQSVIDTVSAMSQNCQLLCQNVQNKGAEFASNDYLQTYYTKAYKADAIEAQSCYRSVQNVLTTSRGTSSYIYNYVVFGENGNGITSGTRSTNAETYQEYLESEEGKRFEGTYVDDKRDGRFVEKDRNGHAGKSTHRPGYPPGPSGRRASIRFPYCSRSSLYP